MIYSCVCRSPPPGAEGSHVLLAEHTAFSGNFKTVAFQCLTKVPARNDRFTFTVDGHTFNFLVNDRVVYCVVAQQEAGRALPFGFLEKVKEEFLVRGSVTPPFPPLSLHYPRRSGSIPALIHVLMGVLVCTQAFHRTSALQSPCLPQPG